METSCAYKHAYSWHQSHDQATVLLLVPHDTSHDDVVVVIERNYLLAGVKGHEPVVKGQLYNLVDAANSAWQLEPRPTLLQTQNSHSRFPTQAQGHPHPNVHTHTQAQSHTQGRPLGRERTASTLSTTSTHSSYALVSDPEISSSFAASLELESAPVSDAEDASLLPSPELSSPASSSADERAAFVRRPVHVAAGPGGAVEGVGVDWVNGAAGEGRVSPATRPHALSSFSSLESLHAPAGRLLTLHLEKDQSIIWPSLIVGPVPQELSPCAAVPMVYDPQEEVKYNMDPMSLVLFAIELFDIRKDRDEAFECFVRAWHRAHLPSATMKLVTHYLPLLTSLSTFSEAEASTRGTVSYHIQNIGGSAGLGQLFFEAGLLHLEGTASALLAASSTSTLSSLRVPQQPPTPEGAEARGRDRDAASCYFECARGLNPELDVPVVANEAGGEGPAAELEMPSMELEHSIASESGYSASDAVYLPRRVRRRILQQQTKKGEGMIFVDNAKGRKEELDSAWYVYVPSLVGAGTALLVVGVIGALSFSSWRRNQGS